MLKTVLKSILIKNTAAVVSVACISVATTSGLVYANIKEKTENKYVDSSDRIQFASYSKDVSLDDVSNDEINEVLESKKEKYIIKTSELKNKSKEKSNAKTTSKVIEESKNNSKSVIGSFIGKIFKTEEDNKSTSTKEDNKLNDVKDLTEEKKETKPSSEETSKEEKVTTTPQTTTTTTKATTTTKKTTTAAKTTTTKKTTTTTKTTTKTTTTRKTTTTTKAKTEEAKASTEEETPKTTSPSVTLINNAYNKIKKARSLSYTMESSILKSKRYIQYNKNQNRRTYKENINGVLVEYYYEGDDKYYEPSERKAFQGYQNIWKRENGGTWSKVNPLYTEFSVDIGFLNEIVDVKFNKSQNGLEYYNVTVSKKSANAYMNTFLGYGANTFSSDVDVLVAIDSNDYIRKVTASWGKINFDFEINGIGATEISRPANLT